ncbi:hypothetical protein [Asanoa siamensis]|uniref:Uncharacterized protein n=1 Tax=Asanoa siamensis TaxID=926357 RepID=A0ABQ4CQ15_9ACTN|nr:hypothetical protein [Asanoa siamensis]GIF72922.1 hypothetical protein Asi02nite_24400 [Asanoa siamensis]
MASAPQARYSKLAILVRKLTHQEHKVNAAAVRTNSLVTSLGTIREARLDSLSASQVAKVVRRIVDHEAVTPKLDVAKFSSAV